MRKPGKGNRMGFNRGIQARNGGQTVFKGLHVRKESDEKRMVEGTGFQVGSIFRTPIDSTGTFVFISVTAIPSGFR
jgi:hypothetical protein